MNKLTTRAKTPPVDVSAELRRLRVMTVPQLQARYAEVFGEPTRTNHKQYLVKRIVWRMQALREGGLSERARRRALELADDAEIRLSAPKATARGPGTTVAAAFDAGRPASFPKPGAVLRREYKGRAIVVRVLPRGFEYEGEVYPFSLTIRRSCDIRT